MLVQFGAFLAQLLVRHLKSVYTVSFRTDSAFLYVQAASSIDTKAQEMQDFELSAGFIHLFQNQTQAFLTTFMIHL